MKLLYPLRKSVAVMLTLLLSWGIALGQMPSVSDAIKWQHSFEAINESEVDLVFSATITPSWHLYGTDVTGGPQPTVFILDKIVGGELVGKLTGPDGLIEKFDPNFSAVIGFYEGSPVFRQRVRVLDPKTFALEGALKYMVCNDATCLAPTTLEVSHTAASLGLTNAPTLAGAGADSTQQLAGAEAGEAGSAVAASELWKPVVEQLKAFGDTSHAQADSSLVMIFVYGFLGGLIALLTPCVWPMIPMTVSFFLKRTKDRNKSIRDAFTYGISIIVIYLTLGLGITAIFGAGALNSLATDATFNILFFLLLVVFAVSFFGAFEITLPASWTNKMDQKADSATGIISILFMAFTLSLVSFSCTGPIIGTLLVQAATMGNYLGPAVGMLGFSMALALPFALFALFPSMLQSMPKSGGWLGSVKVVLAFLELALALKFLSVADLAYGWGILDREVFLVLWIVIFFLLGLYLLGKINFSHDTPSDKTSIPGLFMGIVSMAFALYMVPGLWGAPLRAISAFAPPLTTQDFSLYDGAVHAKFDDYETGMEYARRQGKPVLIDFSGYGCVNCRKMEASVWVNPEVKSIIDNDYVLITLIVDDKTSLPEIIEVTEEDGSKTKLRTVGDKWSYLQRYKFGAAAQPYYVALDHQGNPLTPSRAYNEDVPAYIQWLRSGLEQYKAQQ